MSKFIDLTGQRFGRLVAVEPIRENGHIRWRCECDCGGSAVTTASKLRSGHTQSCGCLQRERTSKASRKDLTGKRYGRLVVVSRIGGIGEKSKYECKCDCGDTAVVYACNLVTGATRSCGCARKENTSKLKWSHGQCGSRLYRCWRNMISRCENSRNKEYDNYGGRGISVCTAWHDFKLFFQWAISNGYSDELTIERINVNCGYSPENCTWADTYTQARNRTNNRMITYQGKTMIVTDWAKETGIGEATIRHRLDAGWTVEETLTKRLNGAAHKHL